MRKPTLTDEAATEAAAHPGGPQLRVGLLLSRMPPAFRREAEKILAGPYSPTVVAVVLTRHGYKVKTAAVRRWRREGEP